jgi:hypothetical protein
MRVLFYENKGSDWQDYTQIQSVARRARFQPRRVPIPVAAEAGAHEQSEWPHSIDCCTRVLRPQPASEPHGDTSQFDNESSACPVLHAPSATDFIYSKRRVARLQQQLVHMRRNRERFLHCCCPARMSRLHKPHIAQRNSQPPECGQAESCHSCTGLILASRTCCPMASASVRAVFSWKV